MSTLKATNIQHASAASANIVLDSSNNVTTANNLTAGGTLACTGNLTVTSGNVILSNGNGIDFSATSGTGTSELFDDYEEGTWTPAFAADGGSAGTAAYTSLGYYTKTGNTVTVWGYVNVSNKGSWSGTLYFNGLPYTSGSSLWHLGGCWITQSTIATQTFYSSLVAGNATTLLFAKTYNAGADAYLAVSDITTSTAMRFTTTYRVA